MKVIISQDGLQVFVCGANALFNVATVEVPFDDAGNVELLYSVGVGGVSFGLYKSRESALDVLGKLAEFNYNQRLVKFNVPKDPEAGSDHVTVAGYSQEGMYIPSADDTEQIAAAYMALKEEMDSEDEIPGQARNDEPENDAEAPAVAPVAETTPKDAKKGKNSGK